MPCYGSQIGKKFNIDGSVRNYVGNTIIANIETGSESMEFMVQIKRLFQSLVPENTFIFLPYESYHMTLMRGINDQVREFGFWPPELDLKLKFEEVDEYFERRMNSVSMPMNVLMRFHEVKITDEDLRVMLEPANEEEKRKLSEFRDRASDAIGFRQPKHDIYTYHVTLAYTWKIPDEKTKKMVEGQIKEVNKQIKSQNPFRVSAPFIAFYNDMIYFSSDSRIRERLGGKFG